VALSRSRAGEAKPKPMQVDHVTESSHDWRYWDGGEVD
jgi:hypothetical protein